MGWWVLSWFSTAAICNSQIPSTTPIVWNARLRKTAGLCFYRRENGARCVRIELSTKVCDSAVRVRDTLVHEMCHAAVWMEIGDKNSGHGPHWKRWAYK